VGRQAIKYFIGATALYSSEKFESEIPQDIFASKFNQDKFQDEHKSKYKRRLIHPQGPNYLITMFRKDEEPQEWWDDKEQTFENWKEISDEDFKKRISEWV